MLENNEAPASQTVAGSATSDFKNPSMLLLILLSGIGGFAMVVVVPLIPILADSLNVSYATAQLSLSVFFASFAVAQLVLGPFSDSYGRRTTLIIGMSLFALGSLACALSETAYVVIFGRGLQGIGAASGMAIARVIINDVHGREKSAKLIGYLTMAMVIGPMAAPTISGFVAEAFGWRWLFWMLFVVSSCLLVTIIMKLPETVQFSRDADGRRQGFFDGLPLFKNIEFIGLAGNWAFSACVYYAFLAGAAYVVIEQMGRSETEYGAYFIIVSLGYLTGNWIAARYSHVYASSRFIMAGTLLALAATITQWPLYGMMHPVYVFGPMSIIAFANGLVSPHSASSVMNVVPRLSGAASGLSGFLQIGGGALISLLVGYFQFQFGYTMIIVMFLSASCGLISLMLCWHIIRPSR
ncbi:MAG: multidrug effflux MFS transporter [Candidatus Puniceispirillum sp.]|nr:multidrug effflux MFS transporter [Candidatus Puniceispirillum sp.]